MAAPPGGVAASFALRGQNKAAASGTTTGTGGIFWGAVTRCQRHRSADPGCRVWRWTLATAVPTAWAPALVFGAVVGTLRTARPLPWLGALGDAYVELFRNLPLLVQMFLWFFV